MIEVLGYPGIVFLMALESMIAPIPSEAVMPFAGFLAYEGKMHMGWIAVASTLGSIIGSYLSYLMGMYGGRPIVLKVGKYLLLNVHHLEVTERFFNKYGRSTVFISRFIPVVRHFISIPAGMGKMPILPFLVLTAIGAGMWNMILAWAGYELRERWQEMTPYFHVVDRIILVLAIAAIALFFWGQIKTRLKTANSRANEQEDK